MKKKKKEKRKTVYNTYMLIDEYNDVNNIHYYLVSYR